MFYPVTDLDYAAEIASKWNAKDAAKGSVTKFQVKKSFMHRYTIQRVGAAHHTEWWIPANDLERLYDDFVGKILVVAEFHRDK